MPEKHPLENIIFTYSPYKKMWIAFDRRDFNNYWNGEPMKNGLRMSPTLEILRASLLEYGLK
jgi:hypothetical protein